jgi:hypothetical protein
MRIAVGVLLCLGIALCSAPAAADTYYKYHDKSTRRDVYVNRLEQVPQKYRSQAQVVLEVENAPAKPGEAPGTAPEVIAPSSPPEPQPAQPPVTHGTFPQDFRQALSGKNLLQDAPAVACAMLDLKLAASGARRLGTTERNDFASLIVTLLIASIVASLAALVAWIAVIVTAVRDEHLWWAFFVFIFSPLGYLYLLIHGGPGRGLRRSLCAAGMLAPILVGAIGAWRFYSYFQAVMQARGVRI